VSEDATLGGYERVHQRPVAFSGSDGHAYTVATLVDDDPDPAGRYGAALLFVRWSSAAERAVGHLETDYLAFGASPDEAVMPLLGLSLGEVKAHLDRCIEAGSGGPTGPGAGATRE
jgi:hypothetical protein